MFTDCSGCGHGGEFSPCVWVVRGRHGQHFGGGVFGRGHEGAKPWREGDFFLSASQGIGDGVSSLAVLPLGLCLLFGGSLGSNRLHLGKAFFCLGLDGVLLGGVAARAVGLFFSSWPCGGGLCRGLCLVAVMFVLLDSFGMNV